MIKLRLDNGSSGASGMIGASYNPTLALAQACRLHLPEDAYDVHEDILPGSPPSQFKAGGAGVTAIRGVQLRMDIEALRSALTQIEDHATQLAEDNNAEVSWHADHVAARTAVLDGALATARAALEPLCGTHKAFPVALKSLVVAVEGELRELAKSKPQRTALAGSMQTLRDALRAELKRIEDEQLAKDNEVLAVLRRRGIAA